MNEYKAEVNLHCGRGRLGGSEDRANRDYSSGRTVQNEQLNLYRR